MEKNERFMTVDECAKVLRCHPGHIRKSIKEGELKAILVGRTFLVERPDLEKYIKSLEVKPHA